MESGASEGASSPSPTSSSSDDDESPFIYNRKSPEQRDVPFSLLPTPFWTPTPDDSPLLLEKTPDTLAGNLDRVTDSLLIGNCGENLKPHLTLAKTPSEGNFFGNRVNDSKNLLRQSSTNSMKLRHEQEQADLQNRREIMAQPAISEESLTLKDSRCSSPVGDENVELVDENSVFENTGEAPAQVGVFPDAPEATGEISLDPLPASYVCDEKRVPEEIVAEPGENASEPDVEPEEASDINQENVGEHTSDKDRDLPLEPNATTPPLEASDPSVPQLKAYTPSPSPEASLGTSVPGTLVHQGSRSSVGSRYSSSLPLSRLEKTMVDIGVKLPENLDDEEFHSLLPSYKRSLSKRMVFASVPERDPGHFFEKPRMLVKSEKMKRNPSKLGLYGISSDLEKGAYVFTWGDGPDGQLGLGEERFSFVPKLLAPETNKNKTSTSFVQVACGTKHTIACKEVGDIASWGTGESGQLGHGDMQRVNMPLVIRAMSQKTVRRVSAGDMMSAAITVEGELYTWGEGKWGVLGHGNELNYRSPKQVECFTTRVWRTTCGSQHLVVMADSGRMRHDDYDVYTCGGNSFGQLGHGDTVQRHTPTLVSSLSHKGVVSHACGSFHTMAVTSKGHCFSWGDGADGRLGHGDRKERLVPTKILAAVKKKLFVVKVACGNAHNILLTKTGEVASFGRGDFGQLGHGDNKTLLVPTVIKAFLFFQRKVSRVCCGAYHNLALTDDKLLYSWGAGGEGQLGNAFLTRQSNTNFPSAIEGLVGFNVCELNCGATFSIVVTTNKNPLLLNISSSSTSNMVPMSSVPVKEAWKELEIERQSYVDHMRQLREKKAREHRTYLTEWRKTKEQQLEHMKQKREGDIEMEKLETKKLRASLAAAAKQRQEKSFGRVSKEMNAMDKDELRLTEISSENKGDRIALSKVLPPLKMHDRSCRNEIRQTLGVMDTEFRFLPKKKGRLTENSKTLSGQHGSITDRTHNRPQRPNKRTLASTDRPHDFQDVNARKGLCMFDKASQEVQNGAGGESEVKPSEMPLQGRLKPRFKNPHRKVRAQKPNGSPYTQ